MTNNYEDLQYKLIENNVNVPETNDLKEFCIMTLGLIFVLFMIFFIVDIGAKAYISQIDFDTQYKIEQIYKKPISEYLNINDLQEENLEYLKKIKTNVNKIFEIDNELNKTNIQFHIMNSDAINAFVMASGDIYITTQLMKEIEKNEDILAFILAHEIGHYKNKHHLQVISRELTIAFITTFLFPEKSLYSFASNINESFYNQYSKKQEFEADKYASGIIKKLYGNNQAGIEFFKLIDKKYNLPEFIHYFSTHPSPKERISLLNSL